MLNTFSEKKKEKKRYSETKKKTFVLRGSPMHDRFLASEILFRRKESRKKSFFLSGPAFSPTPPRLSGHRNFCPYCKDGVSAEYVRGMNAILPGPSKITGKLPAILTPSSA